MRWAPVGRVALLAAAAAAVWLLVERGMAPPPEVPPGLPAPAGADGDPAPALPARADDPRLLALASSARPLLAGDEELPQAEAGPSLVALSLARPAATARVAVGRGADLDAALRRAAAELRATTSAAERSAGLLKVDVLVELSPPQRFDRQGRARIEIGLEGLYLIGAQLWLLPEEIAARRLVDARGDLQSGRLRRYLAETGRSAGEPEGHPGRAGETYRRARFVSWIVGEAGPPGELYRGNPAPAVDREALLAAARAGGEYLLRHQRSNGSFGYTYRADRDGYSDSYNLLRHAGACYSLFELHAATADPRFREAAERGLDWLLAKHLRGPRPEHVEAGFEAVVSPGEEAKLGGAALAALALLAGREATGDGARLPRIRRLALLLLHQQEASGRFESKYFYGAPDPRPFDSVYYPGEAILALARLARVDPDPRWLAAARRGADWLIEVRDAGKRPADLPHDHWLLMALGELYPATGEARYLDQAERIAEAILEAVRREAPFPDWVGSVYTPPRSTPVATRAEALVAMHRLAAAGGLDPQPYRRALLAMAAFELRCQLGPENALYLPRPDRALGGFRASLTVPEVRIDYVQHNVSALLGLRSLLAGG